MNHRFSEVPHAYIQRSAFDRSCGYKTTFDSGFLIPIFVDEVYPGDTFNLRASLFCRMSTPIVPVMDNMFLDTFWFFVPRRLLWSNFQKFMGEQENPGDTTDYLVPQVVAPAAGFGIGTLADYFGIPTDIPNLKVDASYFRAYNLIYNEWFRDENLQDSTQVPLTDGPDDYSLYAVKRRGKRHDYFTSALPWPQKGPAVDIPIGQNAPINLNSVVRFKEFGFPSSNPLPVTNPATPYYACFYNDRTSASGIPVSNTTYFPGAVNRTNQTGGSGYLDGSVVMFNPQNPVGFLDLSSATAVTINSLREAFQVQRLLERDARGGTRYTEILRSHFGVISPDARLQRPEYLGSSSTRININPVQQTSSTNDVTPQGNLAAFGLASDTFHGFTKSFVEHGVIIGLANVRADLTYQQGLDRIWSRRTRFDFYWPSLAHLGEQAILNKEIYAQGNAQDDQTFGYQERWAELRYKNSLITGAFRSSYHESLDIWHLSQNFANLPALNGQFIEDNPPVKRILAVQKSPEFLLDCYFKLKCVRPMPVYSVPGLIDHF